MSTAKDHSLETADHGTPGKAPVQAATPLERRPARGVLRYIRWLLPIGVLALMASVIALLFATSPRPDRHASNVPLPIVRVAVVAPQSFQHSVIAHGSVAPRTESDLVAEVRGRIIWVSPALEVGRFFSEGDEFLHLDGREHEIAMQRAGAEVKLAESEFRLAEAEAARRRVLSKRGASSASDLDQFENRALVAGAALDQARANYDQAALNLERTVVRAPYDGRVRERSVDLGQFVSSGSLLARVFAVDYAEVRLPIRTDELSFLDVPLGFEGDTGSGVDAPVVLTAQLGGVELEWPARLVRTEGEIDLRTRMLHVVARVDDPYVRDGAQRPPLPAGLFVRAEIEGRKIDDVYVLPTIALRDENRVFVVDSEQRLRFRSVDVVRRGREEVVVSGGLAAGEEVVISPVRAVTDGMRVRTLSAGAP